MSTYEERRDQRFFKATRAALQDIEERLTALPPEEWYAGAYGVLRGYFENLVVNFAECFSAKQLAEIRIVLDQLAKITREDTHLNEAARSRLDRLAAAIREIEQEGESAPDWRATDEETQTDLASS
jgi:hypothetical protein